MKYKIGDRVRVRNDLVIGKSYRMENSVIHDIFIGDMVHLSGKEVTINKIVGGKYKFKGSQFFWTDEMLMPLEKMKPIVIYRKDNMVIALDKNTGEKGIAKCSPDDDFNFYTGAGLAFERLIKKPAAKVKLGDILVALPSAPYAITKSGWVGKVVEIMSNDDITVRGLGLAGACDQPLVDFRHLDPKYFRPAEDKDIPVGLLKKIWESEK